MTMTPRVFRLAFAALFAAAAASAQTAPFAVSKCDPETVAFSNVPLPQAVLANGKALAAGTYQVRITTERPTPAVGQSADAECWVEFVKTGVVAGREVASVVSAQDIGTVAKGPAPKASACRVDLLKEGEYVRVWMNSGGTHYIVNMPVAR
jgi:hypothetical protein